MVVVGGSVAEPVKDTSGGDETAAAVLVPAFGLEGFDVIEHAVIVQFLKGPRPVDLDAARRL